MRYFLMIFVFYFSVVDLEARVLTLKKALKIGLKNNQEQKVSQLALEIANAQYLQAKSALYPSFDITMSASRRDQGIAYSLKGNLPLPATLGGGTLPVDVDTTILGRDTVLNDLNLNYALYSGGKITSIINQTKLNQKIKQKNIVRKEQELIFNIKKYFYSYVLADSLYKNANDTFERMKLVEDLTKSLYESRSLKVKKTDYLRTQVITSLIESTKQKLLTSRELALSAIINTIGLPWDENITIKDETTTWFGKLDSIKKMVDNAHTFNSDIQNMKLAIDISDEQITEVKSAFYPQVGVTANAQNMYNSYEYGLNNNQNKNSWTIGIGIKIPLFDGYKDTNRILEKRLEKRKNLQTQVLLENAVAMQIKHAFIEYKNAYKQIKILEKTKQIANQNIELNIQGYQIDLIETSDVIQAQLTQSYANADFSKSLFDYKLSLAKLDKIIGTEIEKVSHEKYK